MVDAGAPWESSRIPDSCSRRARWSVMSIPVTSCAASRIRWPPDSVRADGWKVMMNGSGSRWTVSEVKARPSIGSTKVTPPRPSAATR